MIYHVKTNEQHHFRGLQEFGARLLFTECCHTLPLYNVRGGGGGGNTITIHMLIPS